MRVPATLVLVVCFLAGGAGRPVGAEDAKGDAVKKDREAYAGTWRVVAVVANGQPVPEETCRKITVTNDADGGWVVRVEGKAVARGTSRIDPTRSPKTIDLIPSEGEHKGETARGIYEIAGDMRKICYAPSGKPRPARFSSAPGSGHILATFKREKP